MPQDHIRSTLCGFTDCTLGNCQPTYENLQEAPMTQIADAYTPMPLTRTIGQPLYYVDGTLVGSTIEAVFAHLREHLDARPERAIRSHAVYVEPAQVVTLTLHPLQNAGYRHGDEVVVYWHIKAYRPKNKILILKMLRSLTNVELKEAKEKVEREDILFVDRMPYNVALMLDGLLRHTFELWSSPPLWAEHA